MLASLSISVRDNIDDNVIDYVDLVLRAWFRHWPTTDDWLDYAKNLLSFSRCSEALSWFGDYRDPGDATPRYIVTYLRTAMDKAVSSFVRQFAVLDHALKKKYPDVHRVCGNIFCWLEARIPTAVLTGVDALKVTSERLKDYKKKYQVSGDI